MTGCIWTLVVRASVKILSSLRRRHWGVEPSPRNVRRFANLFLLLCSTGISPTLTLNLNPELVLTQIQALQHPNLEPEFFLTLIRIPQGGNGGPRAGAWRRSPGSQEAD